MHSNKILHNESCKDEKLLLEKIVRNHSSKKLEDFEDTRSRDAFILQCLSEASEQFLF